MINVASPKHLPKNFTQIPRAYKGKVALAIGGIVLFVFCYIAMMISFFYLFTFTLLYRIEDLNKFTGLLKLGSVTGSAMLFLFGLKFLFAKAQKSDDDSLEITQKTEPALYEFVMNLAKETKAPKPKHIKVNNDVNAFVYYNSTFLSLIMPAKKNLMIGMGLMNALNLSEFKAVLAHEFGHFSQSSMRVGSYVYMANRIIYNMVFTRDQWDVYLDKWRALDIRLSFMAWALTPIVWIVRQFMMLFYRLLNLLYASLSREMEFHADKVAVSVSGSDAIVNALWRLEYANLALNNTFQNLYHAAQQGKYSKNLYTHQRALAERMKVDMEKTISERTIDSEGRPIVFSEEVYSSLSMYDSHPPSSEREKNAKSPYVEVPINEKKPTELFEQLNEVQEQLTREFYEKGHLINVDEFEQKADSSVVELFIVKEERDRALFAPELMNNFDLRYTIQPEWDVLSSPRYKEMDETADTQAVYTDLVKVKLKKLMEPVLLYDRQAQLANDYAQGKIKAKKFEFGGVSYTKKNIGNALDYIHRTKLKYLNESFEEWDQLFFRVAYIHAAQLGRHDEFKRCLKLFGDVQQAARNMAKAQSDVYNAVNEITTKTEVDENDFRSFRSMLNREISSFIEAQKKDIKEIEFCPLANIENKDELEQATFGNMEVPLLTADCFEDGSLNQFVQCIDQFVFNLNRVQMKALAKVVEVSGLSLN